MVLCCYPKITDLSPPLGKTASGEGRCTVNLNQSSQNNAFPTINSLAKTQAYYQWKFSTITSSIYDLDLHVKSLEGELCRFERSISNPALQEVLIPDASEAIKSNQNAFRSLQMQKSFRSSPYKTIFGTIVFQTRIIKQLILVEDNNSTQYETTTSFIFHPASWFIRIGLKYGIKTAAVNSRTGWQYNIAPVRAVPDDSLIFRFCQTGNMDAVCELFGRGQASVLDADSRGWRPLHVSSDNRPTCRLLLLLVNPCETTQWSGICLSCMSFH